MEANDIQKACRVGDLELLESIVTADPESINSTDKKLGWTPLYRAVICSHFSIAKVLLEKGANTELRTKMGETALHQAADSGLKGFVQLLLEHHANPNAQQNGRDYIDGDTPLHRAASKGHTEVCQLLIDHKATIDMQNHTVSTTQLARTPLHVAVEAGQNDVVRLFLQKGAATDLQDMTGKLPIDLAKSLDMAHIFDGDTEAQPEESENLLVVSGPQKPLSPPSVNYLKPPSYEPEAEKPLTSKVIIDLNRTFSFGNDTRRTQLLEWLIGYHLEGLLEVLIEAGFDDVDLLVAQVGSSVPLTLDNLQSIGITRPGHRARLLAAIESEARQRLKSDLKSPPSPIIGLFECCAKPTPAPGFAVLPSFDDWLSRLGLKHLKSNFESAGYEDLESLLSLMRTRYALTEDTLLQEIAVQPAAARLRVLQKLREDSGRVDLYNRQQKTVEIEMERGEKTVACKTCSVM